MATRCCWPPESRSVRSNSFSGMPTRSRIAVRLARRSVRGRASIRRAAEARSAVRPSRPASDVLPDPQVRDEARGPGGRSRCGCGRVGARRSEGPERLGRSSRTSPRVGRSVPLSRRSSVVLPAPLGPTNATASPGRDGERHAVERGVAAVLARGRRRSSKDALCSVAQSRKPSASATCLIAANSSSWAGTKARALERREQVRVAHLEQRLLELLREARPEHRLEVRVGGEVVVGVDRRLPDHRHHVRVDLPLGDPRVVDLVADGADLVLRRTRPARTVLSWLPENPTCPKNSRGAFPVFSRMKCSGMSRPDVDDSEPNVKVSPAIGHAGTRRPARGPCRRSR